MNRSTATGIVNRINACLVEGDVVGNGEAVNTIFSQYTNEDLLDFIDYLSVEQSSEMGLLVAQFIKTRSPVDEGPSVVDKVLCAVKNSPQHVIIPTATLVGNLHARHVYKKSLRAHMSMKGREILNSRKEVKG